MASFNITKHRKSWDFHRFSTWFLRPWPLVPDYFVLVGLGTPAAGPGHQWRWSRQGWRWILERPKRFSKCQGDLKLPPKVTAPNHKSFIELSRIVKNQEMIEIKGFGLGLWTTNRHWQVDGLVKSSWCHEGIRNHVKQGADKLPRGVGHLKVSTGLVFEQVLSGRVLCRAHNDVFPSGYGSSQQWNAWTSK